MDLCSWGAKERRERLGALFEERGARREERGEELEERGGKGRGRVAPGRWCRNLAVAGVAGEACWGRKRSLLVKMAKGDG